MGCLGRKGTNLPTFHYAVTDMTVVTKAGSVLVTRGGADDERDQGSGQPLRKIAPSRLVVELIKPATDEQVRFTLITNTLAAHPDIMGVYSMYAFGADRVIINVSPHSAQCQVFSRTISTTTTSNSSPRRHGVRAATSRSAGGRAVSLSNHPAGQRVRPREAESRLTDRNRSQAVDEVRTTNPGNK